MDTLPAMLWNPPAEIRRVENCSRDTPCLETAEQQPHEQHEPHDSTGNGYHLPALGGSYELTGSPVGLTPAR